MKAQHKVLPLDELLARLEPQRRAGRRVVFTNGCYDLLHVGHLHLLESAAAMGDVLVVAVNGDGSVRRLKGDERPLVPFEERARLVAALAVVDFVVGFDEDTPAELIARLVPDVLVKGGDWPVQRIVGRDVVEAAGGRVVSLPLLAGRSTSALLQRLKQL